jgi:hypothetical protein
MAEQEQSTPRSPWRDIMLSSVVSITNVMPSRNSLKPECTATKYLGQGMRQGGRATPRHRLSKRKRGQRHVARHDVFAFVFGQALTPSSDPPDARQLHSAPPPPHATYMMLRPCASRPAPAYVGDGQEMAGKACGQRRGEEEQPSAYCPWRACQWSQSGESDSLIASSTLEAAATNELVPCVGAGLEGT